MQLLVCEKSPLALTPVIFTGTTPGLLTVTVAGLLEDPTATLPRFKTGG